MATQHVARIGDKIWTQAGRVPLRAKIIGIVLATACIADLGILTWFYLGLRDQFPDDKLASIGFAEPLVVMLLSLIVGLIIAWLLTGILTYPIQQVIRVVRQVDKGDLSCRVEIWTDDEIGHLGKAFNAMIENLVGTQTTLKATNRRVEERNKELTTLYELADLVAQSISPEYVQSSGLNKIMKLTESKAGAVLLLNSDGELSVEVETTLSDYALPTLPDLNEPLLWDVIGMGIPAVLPIDGQEISTSQSHLLKAAFANGYQTVFLIPVKTRVGIIGVLITFRQDLLIVDDKTASLLSTICGQLGVAYDNTMLWEELKLKEATRTRLLALAVTAQEQERERISRELHDETGQALTALLIQLKVLERLQDLDAIAKQAGELREIVVGTLEEVRRLARDLRPGTLDDLGLIPTIEWHIRTFSQKSDLEVNFQTDTPEDFRLPKYTELVLYRVVQEALTNVARHANASHVHIRLVKNDHCILVTMEDDGCGFDHTALGNMEERGVGLLGIQERVELIGGTFTIDSVIGHGTHLIVNVPVDERLAII